MNNPNINVNSGDEIVIVIPKDAIEDDEIEIDLDALGIDVENLGEDVNIVIQVEDEDGEIDITDDEDFIEEPNEWFFDDDAYGVVYYEFPEEDDE